MFARSSNPARTYKSFIMLYITTAARYGCPLMGAKPRKNIQKLHTAIHNTAARYGRSLMGVKPRKDIQKLHIVIHGHRC